METTPSQHAEDLYSEHKKLAKQHNAETTILDHEKASLEKADANLSESDQRYADLKQKLKRRRPLGISLPGAHKISRQLDGVDRVNRWDAMVQSSLQVDEMRAQSAVNKIEAKIEDNSQVAASFVQDNPEIQDIAAREAAEAGVTIKI
jgi:hypothetical protein